MTNSIDVRRIARRMLGFGFSIASTSTALGVHRSTIYRWKATGWQEETKRRNRILDVDKEHYLCELICDKRPCIRQDDLVMTSKDLWQTSISQPYVSRMLHRHKITRKIATKRYDQQDASKVESFLRSLPEDASESWWSLDECGFLFNQVHSYAYSRKGTRAVVSRPGPRGKRVSLMLCISPQGRVGHEWFWGGVKSQHFRGFLTTLPKDGTIVLDNASIHKTAKNSTQRLVFLPPYSPQLNPVELCFNVLKSYVKRACVRSFEDLVQIVENNLSTMNMKGFFSSCFDASGKTYIRTAKSR